jgi:hypothetical protein
MKLRHLYCDIVRHDCTGTEWRLNVELLLSAIVDRLEPEQAEEHNDEGMVRNDDWLAECEREWARAYPASWQNKWADRLIAAAKERDALRAQVAALETERDEARAAIRGAYEALKGADCGGNSWRALHDMAYNAHRHLACVLATVKMRDTKPPKLPRPKGPRSKPNEVRARVKRSDLIGEHWSESSGVYQVQCEIDGVTACGYAYCMPGDEFSRTDGYRRALRRAEQALESALSYTGTLVGNCCVTKNYPAKMWEWWRTNPVDNGPAS